MTRRGTIPLAPGIGKLSPVTWPWLTGTPVLFVAFIATLISIPASVIAIVQLVRPVVRRAMSRRAEQPAALPAPTVPLEASSYLAASNPLRTLDFDARLVNLPITIRYAPRCMQGL